VLVPTSKAKETKATMLAVFKEMTGTDGVGELKPLQVH
jgi:hypothetical protein